MIRKIIKIDSDKCNGCGLCAKACHEGAIEMVNGKAVLVREDYCDGLGDCLPACPVDAISMDEREAEAFNAEAVLDGLYEKLKQSFIGCPGERAKEIKRGPVLTKKTSAASMLSQWPCKLSLVPINAPYFDGANLLVAADCSAYAYGDFHNDFIKNHITLIGCPKFSGGDYADKLTAIIKNNNVKSVKVVKMEVPCCSGLESAVKRAISDSGKNIAWQTITITTDGNVIEN